MTSINIHRRAIAITTALTTTVLLVGCTAVADGSAVRDPVLHPGAVTRALLQTGNYPTAPTAPPAPNASDARIMEAQRMAGYVIYPWEVNPGLTDPDNLGLKVIQNSKALGYAILDADSNPDDPVQTIARANGFVNGYATTRGTPVTAPGKHMGLYLLVGRFPRCR